VNEIEQRLTALERTIETQQQAIDRLNIGRSMPSRFLAICCVHWLGIAILTSFADSLQLSIVNGWMFGVLNTGCLWLGIAKLSLSTKILQCAGIVTFMSITYSFLDELASDGVSEVLVLALFAFPALYLTASFVAKNFKFAWHSPTSENSESQPLSIKNLLAGMAIVACYASFLHVIQTDKSEPGLNWLVAVLITVVIIVAIWTLTCSFQRPFAQAQRLVCLICNVGLVLLTLILQTLILATTVIYMGSDAAIRVSWVQLSSTGLDEERPGFAQLLPILVEASKFTLASFIPMLSTYAIVKRIGFSASQKPLQLEPSGGRT